MAVLSKPLNLSFEIDKNKTSEFFKKSDKTAFEKAINRANKHICKAENKK